MTKQKGFTLIELLVVIAIIGILAATVLAALGSARTKAKDAAIKAEISSARAQAELLAVENGDYNEVCGANSATQDTKIGAIVADIANQGGSSVVCSKPTSGDANAWAISATLPGGDTFCADSTGFAGAGKTTTANGMVCA